MSRIKKYQRVLSGILQGHIVASVYFDDALYDGLILETVGFERSIEVTVEPDGSKNVL